MTALNSSPWPVGGGARSLTKVQVMVSPAPSSIDTDALVGVHTEVWLVLTQLTDWNSNPSGTSSFTNQGAPPAPRTNSFGALALVLAGTSMENSPLVLNDRLPSN